MSKNKELINDKPSLRKEVFSIAIPIVICHVLQTMFNVVDLAWLGKLGVEETAAVSWAGNILIFLVTLIMGISIGTTAIVTRNIGAGKHEEASRTAFHALILGALAAGGLAICTFYFIEDILLLLGAEYHIAEIAASYLKIIFCFSVVLFYMYLLSAILRGSGDTRTPVIAIVVATVINLVLDPFLIFGIGFFPRLEVQGAAWATVIARTIGMVICFYYILQGKNKIKLIPHYMKVNFSIIIKILKIGIPGSLQLSMRSLVGLIMIIMVGGFGYKYVAAYGIGLKLFAFAMMLGFGLGETASILIGRALGAKDYDRALKTTLITVFYSAVILQGAAILFMFFPVPLIRLFNSDPDVVKICAQYLKITTIPYALIGAGFVFTKALNGTGDTTSTMKITLLCLWFVQVPLVLFYTYYWKMGVLGIWWGIMIASVLNALAVMAWFLQMKWKTQNV